jgi:membrane protease YdiL (CAAX protease family)
MIACFGITFLAGMAVATPLFGLTWSEIIALMANVGDANALKLLRYFQIIQSLGFFLIPPFIAGWLFTRQPGKYLKLDRGINLRNFFFVVAIMYISLPFINWLISINEGLALPEALKSIEQWMKSSEEEAARLTEAFMKMPDSGTFLFNLVLIALLPAVGEELLFRGLFQRLFHEWLSNIHLAIILSSLIFSALHLQFYGFLPRFVLGMMMGYMFYFSGTLWAPILAHFIQNGTVVIITWLREKGMIGGDYEQFGTTSNGFFIAGSFILVIFFFFLMIRSKKDSKFDTLNP